jgi:hypothetical protein
MLLHQDISAHEISSLLSLYKKECGILYRLTISPGQVKSETEQYLGNFATFLIHDRAKRDFLLATVMEKFPNDVDNISTTLASSF